MKSIVIRRPRRQPQFYFRLTERSEGCGQCEECRAREHALRSFAEQAESERPGHVWTVIENTLVFVEDIVMERELQRKLATNEAVVHRDENPKNNRLENLELIVIQNLEGK